MATPKSLADQYREVYLSGKWVVGTNLKEVIENISWTDATQKIGPHNSIAALVFHLQYYIKGVQQVLDGGSLDIRDKFSFDMQPILNASDWKQLRDSAILAADRFANTLEKLPSEKLADPFVDEKYGTYERNMLGMIEHGYYHLGQIVLLKKLMDIS